MISTSQFYKDSSEIPKDFDLLWLVVIGILSDGFGILKPELKTCYNELVPS
jgi:hypothetical protein